MAVMTHNNQDIRQLDGRGGVERPLSFWLYTTSDAVDCLANDV